MIKLNFENGIIEQEGLAYFEENPFTGGGMEIPSQNLNGQKWNEITYKDGKLISTMEWDEDGNLK